jgi:hypothetical protein
LYYFKSLFVFLAVFQIKVTQSFSPYFRTIGDPAFSGTVQSAPVMAAVYMAGVTHADLVRIFLPLLISQHTL